MKEIVRGTCPKCMTIVESEPIEFGMITKVKCTNCGILLDFERVCLLCSNTGINKKGEKCKCQDGGCGVTNCDHHDLSENDNCSKEIE